jgi:UDP-glucose 4-epimerase
MRVFSEVYGISTLSLRYFNVFGPRQDPDSQYAAVIPKFITSILSHRSPTIFGDGGQTRDFTYIKDVVQANVRAMESGAQGVFNVAYCRRISVKELAAMIMEITGITVPLVSGPPRAGDIRDSLADITRAQQAFGYNPQYTVRTGLDETVAWFRQRING